jgi:DNA repair protein RecO (recombination protein O)
MTDCETARCFHWNWVKGKKPMSRSLSYSVLCLRVRPVGESNREAWFLSAEEGIIKATVFGGPKSRLRAHVAPFNQGRIWIYHDPVRDSRKVTDFDVHSWRPGLRELYERTMAADAMAETLLATHGGGGAWETALNLAGNTLDCLENADDKTCRHVLLNFFWTWTDFLGVQPVLNHCVFCACEVPPLAVLWYDLEEGSLYCENCRAGITKSQITGFKNTGFNLGPGARRWLLSVSDMEPRQAQRYSMDNTSMKQARSLILNILGEALGKRLSLWDELETL